MYHRNDGEAGVFLLGLLSFYRDDWLAELSADRSFSVKWRSKFQTAIEGAADDLAADDAW